MSDHRHHPELASLPDSVAQRVISRAIELDSDADSRMSISRLRDVALEAGISVESFHRALTEALTDARPDSFAPQRRSGLLRRLGQRLVGTGSASAGDSIANPWSLRGAMELVATNVIALGAFWVPTLLLLSFLHSIGLFRSGPLDTGSVLLCTVAGIVLAKRLRARVTVVLLSLCAVGMTVDVIVGIVALSRRTGFLASSAFGWLIAALIGVGIGALIGRWTMRRSGPAVLRSAAHSVDAEVTAFDERARADAPFLRLRLQGS